MWPMEEVEEKKFHGSITTDVFSFLDSINNDLHPVWGEWEKAVWGKKREHCFTSHCPINESLHTVNTFAEFLAKGECLMFITRDGQ